MLIERQPAEAQALKQSTLGHRNVAVVCGDGYAALKAYLPTRENRGLVLIDPSYEIKTDYARVLAALREALERFAECVVLVWLPVYGVIYWAPRLT